MGEHKHAEKALAATIGRRPWQSTNMIEKRSGIPLQSPLNALERVHDSGDSQAAVKVRNQARMIAHQELSSLFEQFEDLYEHAPCGYLNLDAKGLITRINRSGAKLLSGSSKTRPQASFTNYIAPDYLDRLFDALRKADMAKEKQSLELHLMGAKGPDKWVLAQIQAGHNETGKLLQWRMTLMDISAKKEAEASLAASEAKYRQLFDETVTGVALLEIVGNPSQNRITDARIQEVNRAFARCTGMESDRLVGKSIRGLWPHTEDMWFDLFDRVLNGDQNVQAEGLHRASGRYMLVRAFRLDKRRIGITLVDISARKKVEEALEKSRKSLEIKVEERSAEIQRVNLELVKEVETRKIMEDALREKSRELEIRTERLEEANTTLKVLLRERDSERRELEERVASNISELIRPHLSKLCASNLGERRQALVDAIGRGLEDITSPLSRRFIMECSHLTPMETQVAGLIRQGRTTKEISDLMGVAPSTVDYHRFNIRRKLDLTNKRTNLQSYLKSMG